VADARGLTAALADGLDVRDVHGHLHIDDATLLELLAGPGALRTGQRLSLTLADDGRAVTKVWIVGIGDDQVIG